MSETFSSMWANSVAPALVVAANVSVDISILPLIAQNAGERPVLLRHLLDDDVEVRGFGVGVLHHRIGDRADQRFFLRRGPSGPHLNGHDGHSCSCNMFSIRSRMPPHWLAPTVTGARLPNPRPQIAVKPSRFAASKSTPPGRAPSSTVNADFDSRASTSTPTTREGRVEKRESSCGASAGSSSSECG